MSHQSTKNERLGFTLVEVLIVVVILGILAAVVLPRLGQLDRQAMQSALSHDLQALRGQITLYSYQHEGRFPGQGSTNPQDFKDALLLASDLQGNNDPAGTLPLGPYIIGRFPPNPYTNATGVLITSNVLGIAPNESMAVGGEIVGWFYNPQSGRIKGNNVGTTSDGTPLENL